MCHSSCSYAMFYLNRKGLFDRVWKAVLCQDVCKWVHRCAHAQPCPKVWWPRLWRFSQLGETRRGSELVGHRGTSVSFVEFYWCTKIIALWLWHECWSCWMPFPALSQPSDAVMPGSLGVSGPRLLVSLSSWRSLDSTAEVRTGGWGMTDTVSLLQQWQVCQDYYTNTWNAMFKNIASSHY